MRVILNGELKKLPLSASIAFNRTNAEWAKPKPIYKQKEQTHRIKSCMSALFLLVLV